MTKMGKEKKYYFSDIFPLIVGVIVFATLVASLIFVINYDVKKLSPNYKTTTIRVVQEQKVNEDKLTCGKDLVDAANEISIYYRIKQFYVETAQLEDSIDGEPYYEDIYNDQAVVYFEKVDSDKFDIVVKNELGNTYDLIEADPEEEEENTLAFVTSYTKKVLTYTVEIKSKECGDVVRRMEVTPPIFNVYSSLVDCYNYPEFEWCAKYVFKTAPNYNDFQKQLTAYKEDIKNGKATTKTTHKINGKEEALIYTSAYTTKKNDGIKTTTKASEDGKDKKGLDLNTIDFILIIFASVIVIGTITFIVIKRRSGK